jgi:predicted kinase
MQNWILTVGLPGSGKSTWVNDYVSTHPNTIVLSTDNIIESLCKEQGLTYDQGFQQFIKQATKMFNEQMVNAYKHDGDVIIDQTNLSIKSRSTKLKNVPQQFNKMAVIVRCEDDKLTKRLYERSINTGKTISKHIIDSMRKSFQEPSMNEFHVILSNSSTTSTDCITILNNELRIG